MLKKDPSNIESAFEMLLEEVEAEIDFVGGVGARAFEARDYDKAKEALERSAALTAYRDRLAALRTEWDAMAAEAGRGEDNATRARRALRKGIRTPESACYWPILRALVAMDGSGAEADVLEQVKNRMASVLKPVDHDDSADPDGGPPWRRAALAAHRTLTRLGLLTAQSPPGVWEISPRGRTMLRPTYNEISFKTPWQKAWRGWIKTQENLAYWREIRERKRQPPPK